jgi:REP element-mobilizing transposase RayT
VRRPRHVARHPLHVTLRLADGLPSLRDDAAQRVLRDALHASSDRHGLRIVHFSAQRDHLHLLCEAEDERALTRGMRGFGVRLAHALNRLWQRTGALVGDRYHARALRSPREVRNVLAYVFRNARKHGVRLFEAVDPCSSAYTFDGWRENVVRSREPDLLARARTWLLTCGWRRHGPIPIRAM